MKEITIHTIKMVNDEHLHWEIKTGRMTNGPVVFWQVPANYHKCKIKLLNIVRITDSSTDGKILLVKGGNEYWLHSFYQSGAVSGDTAFTIQDLVLNAGDGFKFETEADKGFAIKWFVMYAKIP